jgi:hypothetical protein
LLGPATSPGPTEIGFSFFQKGIGRWRRIYVLDVLFGVSVHVWVVDMISIHQVLAGNVLPLKLSQNK